MLMSMPESTAATNRTTCAFDEIGVSGGGAVLRLLVRNHPGVMAHVCGLFARRAFNVEAILCLPVGDATRSVVLLLVDANGRIEQLLRQLRKLEDVIEVEQSPEARRAFAAAAHWVR